MRYLSVCSGIEAASVAWKPLGWEPVMFSEIEPFPIAVLKHHYPDVPVHGDFTMLIDAPPMCDLLCGGTPCQAFSIAGLRESLADDRGNLTLQFVRLANAIDHLRSTAGLEPGWVLWENVPGVLSTNDNAFGAFLGGLCGRSSAIPEPEGGWTRAGVVNGPQRCAAWRVLDAQHFGLAQRRQRVFVLARGGAGRWAAADALLPIIESGAWHPAPSRKAGQGSSAATAHSTAGGGLGTDFDCDGGLRMVRPGSDVVHTLKGEGFDASEDGTGRGTPLVPVVAKALMAHPGPTGRLDPEVETLVPVIAGTLKANNGGGGWSNSVDHAAGSYMVPVTVRLREGKEGGGKGPLVSEDQSLTLATANDQILAFDTQQITSKVNRTRVEVGMPAGTLTQHSEPHVAIESTMQVRRLTVRECERLMGFPDDYTLIPMPMKPRKQKRKESDESYADYLRRREDRCSADGPRYKALGNSWAVPCARWIGRQIHAITQASKAA